MNQNLDLAQIIQILPKYVQALCSDSAFYFSGEPTIATEGRRASVLNGIAMIKEKIEALEKIMGEHGQQ